MHSESLRLWFLALFDRHRIPFAHFLCEDILARVVNPTDACSPVGLEEQCENLADEVVVFFAFVDISAAFRTGVECVILAAEAYLAPRGFFIFATAGAATASESAAFPAVKAAKCDVLFVR